jgi:hypothetical protein
MITEDYCSFEVAKLLKEKGFNEPCRSYYTDYEDYIDFSYCNDELTDLQMGVWEILRPTHQMAMKWLRKVHQLHISVDVNPIYGKTKNEKGRSTCGLLYWHYMASGEWLNEKRDPFKKAFVVSAKSYEDAVEAALKYSLKKFDLK